MRPRIASKVGAEHAPSHLRRRFAEIVDRLRDNPGTSVSPSKGSPERLWEKVKPILRAAQIFVGRRVWRYFSSSSKIKEIEGIGRMILSPWEYIDSRLYFFGTWEPDISRFMVEHITRGSTCIDIGANVGYYTLLMSGATGDAGRVYSIEPSPPALKRLRENIGLNRLKNVRVIPFGVSDQAGRKKFIIDADNLGASRFENDSEDGLELKRLCDVISREDLADVSVIKVDVEGMEASILREILVLLPQMSARATVIAEISSSNETREVVTALVSRGFRPFLLSNRYSLVDYATPKRVFPKPVDELPPGKSDIAFVRSSLSAME
jgi:FkbM family methyltransferase